MYPKLLWACTPRVGDVCAHFARRQAGLRDPLRENWRVTPEVGHRSPETRWIPSFHCMYPHAGHHPSREVQEYLQSPKGYPMLKAYTRLQARINSLRPEEDGATATEYALVLGLVAIALVIAAVALTPILGSFVSKIGSWMGGRTVG